MVKAPDDCELNKKAIDKLLSLLKPFELSKNELFQIVNLLPSELVELYLVSLAYYSY
jgi:hypothetical protein